MIGFISAASSAVDTYSGQGGEVLVRTHELPFTGWDLYLAGMGGLLILAVGVLLMLLAERD